MKKILIQSSCINKRKDTMAKQTTKKVIKKTTAKKTVIKATVKPAVKPAAVETQAPCTCGCGCGCHKHILKKIVVLAIVFALGMFAGKTLHFGAPKFHKPMFHPVFTNGCLDMATIKCPKMQENILKADVNGDGCVSVEEWKAVKPQHKHMQKEGCPFAHGKHHGKHDKPMKPMKHMHDMETAPIAD